MNSNSIQEEAQPNQQYSSAGNQQSSLSFGSEAQKARVKTQDSKHQSVSRRMSSISGELGNKSHGGMQSLDKKNLARYENTYKMEPDGDKLFNYLRIKEHAQELMTKYLNGEKYDAMKCPKLCKKLSDAINQEVKQLPNPRHKLITIVFISERKLQDMRIASRCLWDTRFDNCVTVEYSNKSLYAVANIYGIYYE
jgi:tctex1 domain-containing protein 2